MSISAIKGKAQQVIDFIGLLFGGRCRVRTCDPCRVKASERHKNAPRAHEKRSPSRHKSPRKASKLHWNYTGILLASSLTACGGGGSSVAPTPAPAAAPQEVAGPYLISAYGDSTQAAQGQPHAASAPGAKVYNRGVSGTNSAQLLAGTDGRNFAWPEMMRVESAKIVVINHGINDRKRPVEDYKADLRALVDGIRKVGKVPMLEEPNPIDEPGFEVYLDAMRELAGHMGVYFCAQPRVALEDGIHPTVQGYAVKAGRLKKCIADVM